MPVRVFAAYVHKSGAVTFNSWLWISSKHVSHFSDQGRALGLHCVSVSLCVQKITCGVV